MSARSPVAVVVPSRDEERHVLDVLRAIPEWVEIVVAVDDGSRDRTWSRLLSWEDRRRVAIRLRPGRGVGGAILEGYHQALLRGAAVVAVVAGDGQMDLGELGSVVEPVRAGRADYVQGTRFWRGRVHGPMPRARQLGNLVLRSLATWAAGRAVSDSQCGYTAASARFLECLPQLSLGAGYGFPAFLRVHAHRLGWRVVEVPVRAIYGDEISGIRPWRDPPRIGWQLLRLGLAARRQEIRRAAGSRPAPLLARRAGPAA